MNALPQKGLIPTKNYKLVSTTSENRANAKLAKHAFDGDPRTHWHTKFSDGVDDPRMQPGDERCLYTWFEPELSGDLSPAARKLVTQLEKKPGVDWKTP